MIYSDYFCNSTGQTWVFVDHFQSETIPHQIDKTNLLPRVTLYGYYFKFIICIYVQV